MSISSFPLKPLQREVVPCGSWASVWVCVTSEPDLCALWCKRRIYRPGHWLLWPRVFFPNESRCILLHRGWPHGTTCGAARSPGSAGPVPGVLLRRPCFATRDRTISDCESWDQRDGASRRAPAGGPGQVVFPPCLAAPFRVTFTAPHGERVWWAHDGWGPRRACRVSD